VKNYEDEVINIKGNCLLAIFIVLIGYSMWGAFCQYKNNEFGVGIFALILGLLGVALISFGYPVFVNVINAKRNQKIAKEIIEKGIKVPGKIIRIRTLTDNNFKNSIFKRAAFFKNSNYNFLIVKYEYNWKKYIIKTPSLNFDPENIKNKDVDVYIYNDKCYVDNIKRNVKKMKSKF